MIGEGWAASAVQPFRYASEWAVMRLIAVALRRGESRLTAFVRDDDGAAKRVDFRWSTRQATDVPPTQWDTAVEAELLYQKSVSHDVLSAFRKLRS